MEEDSPEDLPLSPKVWNPEVTVLVTGQPPSAVEEEEEEESTNVVDIEVIPEIREPLSLLEVLRLSAVLEDTLDQLSILNYIMPVHYERKQSTSMNISSLEKSLLVSTNKISTPVSTKEKPTLPEIPQGGQFSMEFNRMQDLVFKQPTMQSIMSTEIMKKIQIDRMFFSDVIENTMQELQDSGTFTTLLQTLNKEREKKMHFYDIIAREEKGRKQIKSLQKQLSNVKKERQAEVQKLRMKTEEENRIHMEIEMFLRKEQQKLEEKLEFWMEKFDKDTEMKQNELNALKAAKASDLTHLQDLAKMIREYEQVIIEDRIEKEKTRKKIEQDELELRSAIKLQAWWRGTVVRREIGSFKMPKDKDDSKDAKGKGKGKGKGKDKDKRRGKK
ncbi:dynein regulatory complex protein 9 isoform X3 [Ictidomys tridecemlineatus]